MSDEVIITIDGTKVVTRAGKMVLEAAIEAGIYVPYLCYHPGLKPFAACRMCLVEVDGGRGYPASCTLPVQNGMVVNNNSPGVQEARHNILELLIAEHPHGCLTCHRVDLCGPQDVCLRHVSVNDRCVTCPKNERCELKDTTRYVGVSLESPLDYKYRDLPIEAGDPFYDRDYNLCIVCGRCVRACEELRGDNAITFTERAGQALVGTVYGTSLLESGCEFCGSCIDVCPVGALVEKDNKWEKASRVVRTICPHCPVGCQLNLEVNRFDKVIRVIPELNSPSNHGQACFKGKFGLDFVNHKARLRHPLIRQNGELKKSTWDEALDLIAHKLASYSSDDFAMLTSPNSTNEEHYIAQKFARTVMGTNNIDQSSNIYPELVMPLLESLGNAAATNPIWSLEESQCLLTFNANVTEEHNVAAIPIKKNVKAGGKLLVIDSREVELTRYATIWLRPIPGTELILLGGLLKALDAQGLTNAEWIAQHWDKSEVFLGSVRGMDLAQVSLETSVPRDKIEEASRLFAQAKPAAIIYALDNVVRELRTDCVKSLVGLTLLTGNIGVPGGGLYPLRQGANEQGAWDVGCVPNLLPGYRRVGDYGVRHTLGKSWDANLPKTPGVPVHHMWDSVRSGHIKTMIVIGNGANLTNGDVGDAIGAMESLEFLVVQDSFMGSVAQQAHVVLPRSTFAEKDGTYTNLERRIQLLRRVVSSNNSQAQPEFWSLCEIAKRMGAAGFEFENPSEVMEEIAKVVPQYGGVSHKRLEAEAKWVARTEPSNPQPTQMLYSDKMYPGIQWPCRSPDQAGTSALYTNGSSTHLKVTLEASMFRKETTAPQPGFPLFLTPGRVLLQSDRKSRLIEGVNNRIERDELAELNPDDATAMEISEGELVEVVTPLNRFTARATLNESVPRGVVSCTSIFGQLASELQTSEIPDPMSFVPKLNITPARLEKTTPALFLDKPLIPQ